jgi:hypothetical protein
MYTLGIPVPKLVWLVVTRHPGALVDPHTFLDIWVSGGSQSQEQVNSWQAFCVDITSHASGPDSHYVSYPLQLLGSDTALVIGKYQQSVNPPGCGACCLSLHIV